MGDYVYLGHGHNNGFPQCVDLKMGELMWEEQRGAGSGSAAIAYADGHLFFRYQDHTMALFEATPDEYRLKGSFKIGSSNKESWPHPVIQQGRLYLGDQVNCSATTSAGESEWATDPGRQPKAEHSRLGSGIEFL